MMNDDSLKDSILMMPHKGTILFFWSNRIHSGWGWGWGWGKVKWLDCIPLYRKKDGVKWKKVCVMLFFLYIIVLDWGWFKENKVVSFTFPLSVILYSFDATTTKKD